MAVKKTTKKNEEVTKARRVKETNIICIILIYIVGIAAVGVGAYAFTEKGFVENRLSTYARKYAESFNGSAKTFPYIDGALDESVCKNVENKVTCVKNISDSKLAKGYVLLLTETYDVDGDAKKNIAATLTVNGTVVTIDAGYEVDSIEPKNINGKNLILVNTVNKDGNTKALLLDSIGRNAAN